ncbi:MAG: T9SS type A sorting domain-containing protein [Chitinophagales bacterium]
MMNIEWYTDLPPSGYSSSLITTNETQEEHRHNLFSGDIYSMSILNTLGQIVYFSWEKFNGEQASKQLNLYEFATGVYFLQINSAHFSGNFTFIISK